MAQTYPDHVWKPKDVEHIYKEHNKSLTCYCLGCRLYRFEIKEEKSKS